jgi:hypothetical protein
MSKYDYLKKKEPKGTVPYVLERLDKTHGEPTLIVAPAFGANKDYFNALLKRRRTGPARLTPKKLTEKLEAHTIEDTRNDDKVLYPRHVIKGWENITDNDGKKVPFSVEEVTEFLKVLPDWIFDEVRVFCVQPENFVEEELPDTEEVSKN